MQPDVTPESSVYRIDGTRGKVTAWNHPAGDPDLVDIEFEDGLRISVPPVMLLPQEDGSFVLPDYDFTANAQLSKAGGETEEIDEVYIPVVAEELSVEKKLVERGRVRVIKRVESREEEVELPLTSEEIRIERIPYNTIIDGEVPKVREEDGFLVVPLLEEVLVVEKRLLLREEIRVAKRLSTTTSKQTVVLRREVVDIEREETGDTGTATGFVVSEE
jgi:uncharacterized protein (TIGR02271 family)